ncbi:MAG: hypothetical protein KBS86_02295 [Proteobacteria bacterium]|nr:hypothetical protein [Candidatus Enterousia scatequi]
MKKIQTDSYTIAHYVLLFLVIVVVIWFVIWAIRSTRGEAVAGETKTTNPSCVQQTIDSVAQMWINDTDKIPQEYTDMMIKHANRVVKVKTRGNCNGQSFVCEMGAVRASCDPCAIAVARQMAIDKHTSDMVLKNCNVEIHQTK